MTKLSVDRALRKAKSHERNGQMDEAVKLYHSVLAVFPSNIRAKQGLAKLSQPKPGTLAGKNPSDETLNQLIALYNKGQIRTVTQECDRLTKEFPQSFLLWNLLGAANNAQGKLEEAIAAHNKALLIKPDFAEAHNNIGAAFQSQGKFEEASAAYNKALLIKPDYARAHYNLGITLQELGRLEEAVASYRKAIALKPDYAEAHYNLGNTLQELGRSKDAEASYRKAIALKPDYAEAHSNLGVTLQELGKLEDALVQYKKSFELVRGKNPVDPQHQSFRLISKAKMKHDIEQFEYLAASGYESEKFQALVNVYKAVSSEINWPTNDGEIIPLTDKYQKLLMDTYNRSIHVLEAPELPGPTLSNTLDIEKITENYFKHDFDLTYFDNFLTPVALDSIRHFLLGSTIWFDFFHKGGYIGAYLRDGLACPLFFQIAEEMRTTFPKIFKNHPLKQLWAYKYDSRAYKNDSPLTGINAHADYAAVNVNFWVTPKAANLNSLSGGLVVYNTVAPLEWDSKTFNNDTEKILEHLEDNNNEKSVIPYNENRIVIFNSNLIHETDKFEFKEGYENRRINVTMLFGERGT
ncbi:MAG: tetratricopeptide repeat protein [Pseudomonadales bacterium]|nr:tetratricopeptide repeat protein [Pseudomonadales bacterium]